MAKLSLLSRPAIVYLITNKINNKKYVGATSTTLSTRISAHFADAKRGKNHMIILRALRKYGRDGFDISVLEICDSFGIALEREKFFIAEIKPEYNSTKGGEGHTGRKITKEQREKMIAGIRASNGRKGTSQPESCKKTLRELGLKPENQEKWKKYSHLGPKSFSRSVICLDDGVIYESASAAARAYGSCKSAIIELCLGQRFRKTVNGRKFKYVDSRITG